MGILFVFYSLFGVIVNVSWYSQICITVGATDGSVFIVFWWFTCLIFNDIGLQINDQIIMVCKFFKIILKY